MSEGGSIRNDLNRLSEWTPLSLALTDLPPSHGHNEFKGLRASFQTQLAVAPRPSSCLPRVSFSSFAFHALSPSSLHGSTTDDSCSASPDLRDVTPPTGASGELDF